jgi:hypothetical protein
MSRGVKVLVTATVVFGILAVATPIGLRLQYDRAVARCTATPPGEEVWEGAQQGFQLAPPGFWCEHQFPDGRVERENYGLFP